MIHFILHKLSQTEFVQSAVAERADLSAFKERPTPRIILGLWIIGLSYLIGWPAVSALGVLSVYWKNPLIITIGGPPGLWIVHLVFILGMYFAGARHARLFLKWAARVAMEKLMGDDLVVLPRSDSREILNKNASGR